MHPVLRIVSIAGVNCLLLGIVGRRHVAWRGRRCLAGHIALGRARFGRRRRAVITRGRAIALLIIALLVIALLAVIARRWAALLLVVTLLAIIAGRRATLLRVITLLLRAGGYRAERHRNRRGRHQGSSRAELSGLEHDLSSFGSGPSPWSPRAGRYQSRGHAVARYSRSSPGEVNAR